MTTARTSETRQDWRTIEQDARAQALASLTVDETTPLEWGQLIAWAECRYARTDGLSVVHRAGEAFGASPKAICGAIIPSPLSWLPAHLHRALGRCKYCELGYTTKGVFGA